MDNEEGKPSKGSISGTFKPVQVAKRQVREKKAGSQLLLGRMVSAPLGNFCS